MIAFPFNGGNPAGPTAISARGYLDVLTGRSLPPRTTRRLSSGRGPGYLFPVTAFVDVV